MTIILHVRASQANALCLGAAARAIPARLTSSTGSEQTAAMAGVVVDTAVALAVTEVIGWAFKEVTSGASVVVDCAAAASRTEGSKIAIDVHADVTLVAVDRRGTLAATIEVTVANLVATVAGLRFAPRAEQILGACRAVVALVEKGAGTAGGRDAQHTAFRARVAFAAFLASRAPVGFLVLAQLARIAERAAHASGVCSLCTELRLVRSKRACAPGWANLAGLAFRCARQRWRRR